MVMKVVNQLLGNRLTQARKAAGLSQTQLGDNVGLSQTAIAEIEAGRIRRPKKLREIAAAVGSSEEWLLGEGDRPLPPRNAALRYAEVVEVPIVGPVEAGVFREIDAFDDAIPQATIMAARDPRFPRAKLYAFTVQGDSMNAADPPIMHGDMVLGVDFMDSGLPLRNKMIVVAQASRDSGHMIERTLKEVATYRDRVELIPRSTNPKYKKITIQNGIHPDHATSIEGTEIRILAVIIRKISEIPI